MSHLALTSSERGIVVFKLFPSLSYARRMQLSFLLISVGLLFQWLSGTILIGAIMILAGNLFLLVSGYDNLVEYGRFEPSAEWQKVDRNKLEEVKGLQKRIRRWDTSALDITNVLGFVVFAIVIVMLMNWIGNSTGLTRALGIDAAILLVPHWLTGTRRILLLPQLLVKVKTIDALLKKLDPTRFNDSVEIMMLLRGQGKQNIPDDVKFKVTTVSPDKDFLGLYGQVVINSVQGNSYPYFYVVLVARKGFGLRKSYDSLKLPTDIIKEFKSQDEVDVIVIRQFTTSTSGYHTDEERQRDIFLQGLSLMREIAPGPPA